MPFKDNFILHIGYPKTASSFLQRKVFSRVNAQGKDSNNFVSRITEPYTRRKLSRNSEYRKFYAYAILRGMRIYNPFNIYSSEHILAPNFFSNDLQLRDSHYDIRSTLNVIRSVHQYFQKQKIQLKILVTIRPQNTWLGSFYAHRSIYFDGSQNHFDAFVRNIIFDQNHPVRNYLDMKNLSLLLKQEFEQDNILFFCMSDLSDDLKYVKLLKFCNLPTINIKSDPLNYLSVAKNKWHLRDQETAKKSSEFNIPQSSSTSVVLNDEMEREINKIFRVQSRNIEA